MAPENGSSPYPASIGYHPGRNALIALATDPVGKITGGQFIHLDAEAHKLTKAEAIARHFRAPKESFGTTSGATARLPARDRVRLYSMIPIRFIAESVEAGAAIWQITGQETDIILDVGNLRHALRMECANVVCVDDDARGSAAWKQANRAIRTARAAGHVVLIVNPWQIRRGDNSDLNDILRQSGPEGPDLLRQRLSATLFPEAPRRKRERADLNLDLAARARFWLSLAALLDDQRGSGSGWLRIATDRSGQTILRMRGRRPVNAAWKVPTILTDASLQTELVRHLWPDMRLVADIAVEARHQHIKQVIDRSYALSSLDANDPTIADDPTRHADDQ